MTNEEFFETKKGKFNSYFEYQKYKMTIRGMKAGMVLKGTKILIDLYSEKDLNVRNQKKKELKLLLVGLDGMNYFHDKV